MNTRTEIPFPNQNHVYVLSRRADDADEERELERELAERIESLDWPARQRIVRRLKPRDDLK